MDTDEKNRSRELRQLIRGKRYSPEPESVAGSMLRRPALLIALGLSRARVSRADRNRAA